MVLPRTRATTFLTKNSSSGLLQGSFKLVATSEQALRYRSKLIRGHFSFTERSNPQVRIACGSGLFPTFGALE